VWAPCSLCADILLVIANVNPLAVAAFPVRDANLDCLRSCCCSRNASGRCASLRRPWTLPNHPFIASSGERRQLASCAGMPRRGHTCFPRRSMTRSTSPWTPTSAAPLALSCSCVPPWTAQTCTRRRSTAPGSPAFAGPTAILMYSSSAMPTSDRCASSCGRLERARAATWTSQFSATMSSAACSVNAQALLGAMESPMTLLVGDLASAAGQ
jgi:hypothetical protein